jgi:repressor LexA
MAKKQARYLTERQKAILEFIEDFQRRKGIAPTHREICEHFGYSSYGTVYKHLKLLEQKGYLTRDWNQKRGIQLVEEPSEDDAPDLPFLGRIAAGRPIEAMSGNERLEVPHHLLSRRTGDHYVLQVVGDSMIAEGIHDGDLVVVLRREKAEPGEMVVALVNDEATLKRFYPEGDKIRLQPSNPAMDPIWVAARDLTIQGVVVGLMRKYL